MGWGGVGWGGVVGCWVGWGWGGVGLGWVEGLGVGGLWAVGGVWWGGKREQGSLVGFRVHIGYRDNRQRQDMQGK